MQVIGIDTDGCLLIEDVSGDVYNCGETVEEFGIDNLNADELRALGVI
jgi:hypothetical protein